MDKYLSKKELSAFTGYSISVIRGLMREGLPYIKSQPGKGRVTFDPVKVKQWLEANKGVN